MTKAPDILNAAAAHMADRAATYDRPEGERSMARTVAAFNAVTGHEVSEVDGWLFMTLLKQVRSYQGAYRQDNHEDEVAYAALRGEAAAEAAPTPDETPTPCTSCIAEARPASDPRCRSCRGWSNFERR